MNNFEEKLKQLNNKLEPTLNQKKAIKNSLFNDLNVMENKRRRSRIFGFSWWAVAICSVFGLFLIPTLFLSFVSMTNDASLEAPNIISQEDENVGSNILKGFPEIANHPNEFGLELDRNSFFDKEEDGFLGISEHERRKDVNALYSILVEDLDSTYLEIKDFIIESNGFVKLEDKTNYSGIKYSWLLFEIPQDKFSEFQIKLDGWAFEVISEELSIEDKEVDMQENENQIEEIQTEIDELEAKNSLTDFEEIELERLKSLTQTLQDNLDSNNNKLRYVTIELEIQEKIDDSITTNLNEFGANLIDSLGKVLLFWIYAIGYLLLGIIALSPILLLIFVITKIIKRKNNLKNVSRENKGEKLPKK